MQEHFISEPDKWLAKIFENDKSSRKRGLSAGSPEHFKSMKIERSRMRATDKANCFNELERIEWELNLIFQLAMIDSNQFFNTNLYHTSLYKTNFCVGMAFWRNLGDATHCGLFAGIP